MLRSYRLVSLLPLFAKTFEKIIFTSMFEYFIKNELFTVCQPAFLLSIIHEIQKSLDKCPSDLFLVESSSWRFTRIGSPTAFFLKLY